MTLLDRLSAAIGAQHVLTGTDTARYATDWTAVYSAVPLAVVRPANTAEVADVVRIVSEAGVAIVPVGGNTGLCGGTYASDAIMVSLERMNAIREIRPEARVAVVEAGVVLDTLHAEAAAHGLTFPLTFGARGSAMIGGCLSTNAGGSNVLRYGSTRGLCFGLEVVLPSGEVLDLMTALHKDNSGYDLKDLFIGAEGTLGIITAATLKLVPKPSAYATAMVALSSLDDALALLNRLQEATGGAVEAFEYMPGATVEAWCDHFKEMRPPFDRTYDVNILVEVGATAPRDATPAPDGSLPVVDDLETLLGEMLEEGTVLDAVVARSEAQRAEMWNRREHHADVALGKPPFVNADVSVPLDRVQTFLDGMASKLPALDPEAYPLIVCHLGDGNIHYSALISSDDLYDPVLAAVEDQALSLGGSFSAEHGIGKSKLASMRRRKDPVALKVMRQVKAALDPEGLMNPGKVLPEA
ncbi:FAD-binding oxidoreductase [Tropicimonas isoalkanivorans]|uniref:FAD/FMN-containing dehydrogenase n=1 Tax=Tropicimonas isoalkanivorans TaxID=441112 RepID=A0A1I1QSW5_9RHOB|nr:FAD-binding oxidoreductase [Tropicimonas isoalkanivorans]SFD25115.1 FAD/FMN-containing dehydrogenase [Tropicimonas isoalkanivorans]